MAECQKNNKTCLIILIPKKKSLLAMKVVHLFHKIKISGEEKQDPRMTVAKWKSMPVNIKCFGAFQLANYIYTVCQPVSMTTWRISTFLRRPHCVFFWRLTNGPASRQTRDQGCQVWFFRGQKYKFGLF